MTNAPTRNADAMARELGIPRAYSIAMDVLEMVQREGLNMGEAQRIVERHLTALESSPADGDTGAILSFSEGQAKWLNAAAEFLDHCAGMELEFEGLEHGALAIVEGMHEALFDDELDMPFHEAVAHCLKSLAPTETGEQG